MISTELLNALTLSACASSCGACERDELTRLWSELGEGPMHPDVTVADLPELRRLKSLVVHALTD